MLRGDLGESHYKIAVMMSKSQQLVLILLLQSILRRFRIQGLGSMSPPAANRSKSKAFIFC